MTFKQIGFFGRNADHSPFSEGEADADAEIILDRLTQSWELVVPEIVSATRAQLLNAGTDFGRVEMIAKCEYHVRAEIAEAGDLVHAIAARLDFDALDQNELRLVASGPGGQQIAFCRSLKEVSAVASNDWDWS
ncbi:hypothetical protein SAMN05444000_1123 [Shimia gijangensis]|uniref:Uncharacterized protein n=2 Tax=Shimia gijangensis TaxID=1470563 RepID=A0A1M6LHQ5_9RHOB|nr:hypothetical protein SAMN05444000_1123 [Shimia gijangensis]